MYNLKKLRDKYDQIKSLNPNLRASSVQSIPNSFTPSKQQRDIMYADTKKKSQKSSIIQIGGNKLVCSPCYNKRLLNQKQTLIKQERDLEREIMKNQISQQMAFEQHQIDREQQLSNRRREQERENLKLSQKLHNQKLQDQNLEKRIEIENYQDAMRKYYEEEKIEVNKKKQRVEEFNKELKRQIEYKEQHKKNIYSETQFNEDPYWKYFQQEEEELNIRRRQQEQQVQTGWNNYQKEKEKQKQQEKDQKMIEQQERFKTQNEFYRTEQELKAGKKENQKQLIMDLNAQIKQKQQKKIVQQRIEQQKQRELDLQEIKKDQDRIARERSQKTNLEKQMAYGLIKQVEYNKQLKSKQQQQSLNNSLNSSLILRSTVERVQIECADCHKKQVPNLLTQI